MNDKQPHVLSQISRKYIPYSEAIPISHIRLTFLDLIKKEHSDIDESGFISQEELKEYRKKYVQNMLETEKGDLSNLEKDVLNSMMKQETVTENIEKQFEKQLTFGERVADKIAEFGGSWTFILIFFFMLATWIGINTYLLFKKPFDPYPFILLNLILSCLASIQAPVIMMSQNRKEDKDRMRAENDYKVNLKAELEIQHLHEKIDTLMQHQWQRLLEIQQLQMDMMEDQNIKRRTSKRR